MILAFTVYATLLIVICGSWLYALASPSNLQSENRFRIGMASFLTVLVFTLLIGGRYDVGLDYWSYIYYYETSEFYILQTGTNLEPTWELLIRILKYFDLNARYSIAVAALIQISFISIWLAKNIRLSVAVAFGIFTSLLLLEVNNTIRQGIALFALWLCVDALGRRQYLSMTAWLVIAAGFHRSAILIVPFLFLGSIYRDPKPKLDFTVLSLSYIIFPYITEYAVDAFNYISNITSYERYALTYARYDASNRAELAYQTGYETFGLGSIYVFLIDATIIYMRRRLESSNVLIGFRYYYVLFLVGAVLQPLLTQFNALAVSRAIFYFTGMKAICLGAIYVMLAGNRKEPKDLILLMGLLMGGLLWFIVAISRGAAGSSPYHF